jgi:two-component system phosphate regulon sensor histidine kinase PhoR
MNKNITGSNWAALLTTITVMVVSSIAFWLVFLFESASNKLFLVVLAVLLIALASFVVTRITVQRFVYDKVKIIFKIIHGVKAGSHREEVLIARKSNLKSVEMDVKEWADQRSTEITELKARETFRREFIGNVSHELKTPIFNIQGYILTLIDGGLEDPNINMKYLVRASKSIDRMINLIQDMDTLNKLESGVMEVKMRPFEIVMLVQDVLDSLEDSAKDAGMTIQIKAPKKHEELKVLADPGRIEQVLLNLLTNAIKYGKKGGKVVISFFDIEDRILVEVADNGLGIPEKDVSRIFERFYRVDKSRTRDAGGSGLGLSIVKHILDAHKQTINVQSKVGIGSTFSFTLQKASN